MIDTVFGILAALLPIAFVVWILLAEFDFKWGMVLLYFVVMGGPAILILFYNPFRNLTDWQIATFGVMFAFALVGIHHFVERRNKSSSDS